MLEKSRAVKGEEKGMKAALAQTNILWEDKEENLLRAKKWLREAKKQEAQLLCFPEMSFTGFSMQTEKTAESEGGTVRLMQKMAHEYRIAIGFGWVEKTEGKARNHYTVADEAGILSDYVKVHPFSYSGENRYFEAGEALSVFQMGGLRIGTLLCYDLRFPEPFQILAETCDLIIVAANWPEGRREHWKCLLQARAIECQVYLAGVNCCGRQKGLPYAGDSCIFAPDGKRIAGFLEGEGLLTARIREDTKEYRKEFPVRADRRWELYRRWYE